MASVQWARGRLKTKGAVRAQVNHNSKDTRLRNNHSNPHIDKSKTSNNLEYFDLTAEQVMEKFEKRLNEVKGKKGITKNTVQMHMLNVPVPAWLPEEDERKFMDYIYQVIGNITTPESIIQMWMHKDEIHEYVDPQTYELRMSQRHIHIGNIPCVQYEYKKCLTPEQREIRRRERQAAREAGIPWNAKKMSSVQPEGHLVMTPGVAHLSEKYFYTKENMELVNQAIDDWCYENYGMHYMTGGTKNNYTVEELKQKSEVAKSLLDAKKREQELVENLETQTKELDRKIKDAEAARRDASKEKQNYANATKAATTAKTNYESKQREYITAKENYEAAKIKVDHRAIVIKRMQQAGKEIAAVYGINKSPLEKDYVPTLRHAINRNRQDRKQAEHARAAAEEAKKAAEIREAKAKEWERDAASYMVHIWEDEEYNYIETVKAAANANIETEIEKLVNQYDPYNTAPPDTTAGLMAGVLRRFIEDIKHYKEKIKDYIQEHKKRVDEVIEEEPNINNELLQDFKNTYGDIPDQPNSPAPPDLSDWYN